MYQGFPKMRGPLFDKNVRKADLVHMEVPPRFELGSGAFAELCLTTWLWHHLEQSCSKKLERVTRLELATSTLARWRSTR